MSEVSGFVHLLALVLSPCPSFPWTFSEPPFIVQCFPSAAFERQLSSVPLHFAF